MLGRVGSGPFTILMDGHIDCVGVGDPAAWAYDPFKGKLEDGKVYGRGAVDELPAIATMAYGMKLLVERGLPDRRAGRARAPRCSRRTATACR